jgi:branched-chain amino acid transport system permease protein
MELVSQFINGVSKGGIYALIALGYTLVYGIAKLINFAHGDIIMVGAYVALFTIPAMAATGVPLWLCVLPAIIVCVALGMVIERVAYRPLRNSPRISNLITAIGVSMLLQNGFLKAFGASQRPFPEVFAEGSLAIGPLNIGIKTVITIVVTFVLTGLLTVFMKKSKYGKAMIAVSEDYGASRLVGINVDAIIQLTFGIGCALAAVASLLYATTYPQVTPYMGSMPGIKAFVAAVIGGIGNATGAVIGGIILGIIESLTAAYISSELVDAISFGILIVVLLVKPTGLLGTNINEKV